MTPTELRQLAFIMKEKVFGDLTLGIAADSDAAEVMFKSMFSSQSMDAVQCPRYVAQSSRRLTM